MKKKYSWFHMNVKENCIANDRNLLSMLMKRPSSNVLRQNIHISAKPMEILEIYSLVISAFTKNNSYFSIFDIYEKKKKGCD